MPWRAGGGRGGGRRRDGGGSDADRPPLPPQRRAGSAAQAPSPVKRAEPPAPWERLPPWNPAPGGGWSLGFGGFFLAFEEPVPRISGSQGLRIRLFGRWDAEGPQPRPSRGSRHGQQGARPHRRRNHPWNTIFFFSHPHRNQRNVSGHSSGRGVEGKKSPVAPGVSLASQSQPPPAQCRFTTGCAGVQEMSTAGCKAGATPTGPSCSTTASAPPGTVCRAPPPPMRRDPRWSSCHPPRTPHPQNPHFPSRLPLYPHPSPQPPPPR